MNAMYPGSRPLASPLGGPTGLWVAPIPVSEVEAAGVRGCRIVRHGLADVLRWLGEEVGPGPDDPVVKWLMFDPHAMAVTYPAPVALTEEGVSFDDDVWTYRAEERIALTILRQPPVAPQP